MEGSCGLRHFCERVTARFGSPHDATEDEKAEEFRRVYLKGSKASLETLKAVALDCGIRLNGLDGRKLPPDLRGYHDIYGDSRNIYYKEDDSTSGIENTILHELREMMEPLWAETRPGYEPLRTSAVHLAANRFAAAVLLPEGEFRAKVYDSGFDVITLSRHYSKSCSQALLRMGEVLQRRLFLYAALYERHRETGGWTLNYWIRTCNEDDPEANVHGVDGLFPRKRRPVAPGSLVDIAIREVRPVLAKRITISDDGGDPCLAAIAAPLVIAGSPAKVALVSLLGQDRDLLRPQIDGTDPLTVEGFHWHL